MLHALALATLALIPPAADTSPKDEAQLQAALTKKDLALAKKVLAGVDREFLDRRHILHRAIEQNFMGLVPELLERGASVHVKDAAGCTPLHLAVQFGPASLSDIFGKTKLDDLKPAPGPDIVALLLKHKADLEAEDDRGRTPLFYAIPPAARKVSYKAGHMLAPGGGLGLGKFGTAEGSFFPEAEAQLRYLLKHGAKVNAADKNGLTPLHYAALIDDEKNYTKQTRWFARPLSLGFVGDAWSEMTTVKYDGREAVKILLIAGADPKRLTNAGKTAFDLSTNPASREILDLAMSAKK